jgi:biopolymer transport protein ExbB/TolQ
MPADLIRGVRDLSPVAWGVILTLLAMSVVSLGIVFERYWTYRRAGQRSRRYAAVLTPLLRAGRIADAMQLSSGQEAEPSPLARVIRSGLQEWHCRQEAAARDVDVAAFAAERAVRQEASLCLSDLRRGLSVLATIASTAPFVGLFGTTFGIINAFHAMALTGAGGLGVIASGIAEALITTALGLFVAVPATWAYNFFLGRVEGFAVELERSGYLLVNHLTRQPA